MFLRCITMDCSNSIDVKKIVDTLVLARMAFPDPFIRKDLTSLAFNHLGLSDFADGMKLSFKAGGYKTIKDGYAGMDIDSPIYRQGAMSDTVATLRLEPILRELCREWSMFVPFNGTPNVSTSQRHGQCTDRHSGDRASSDVAPYRGRHQCRSRLP